MESNHRSSGCHPDVFAAGPRDRFLLLRLDDRGGSRTHKVTSLSCSPLCQFAYRAAVSSSGGTRTHSILSSKPRWSANCLPSRISGAPGSRTPIFCLQNRRLPVGRAPHVVIHFIAQSRNRTCKHSGLSRVALPVGVPGRCSIMPLGRARRNASFPWLPTSYASSRGALSPVDLR